MVKLLGLNQSQSSVAERVKLSGVGRGAASPTSPPPPFLHALICPQTSRSGLVLLKGKRKATLVNGPILHFYIVQNLKS